MTDAIGRLKLINSCSVLAVISEHREQSQRTGGSSKDMF